MYATATVTSKPVLMDSLLQNLVPARLPLSLTMLHACNALAGAERRLVYLTITITTMGPLWDYTNLACTVMSLQLQL